MEAFTDAALNALIDRISNRLVGNRAVQISNHSLPTPGQRVANMITGRTSRAVRSETMISAVMLHEITDAIDALRMLVQQKGVWYSSAQDGMLASGHMVSFGTSEIYADSDIGKTDYYRILFYLQFESLGYTVLFYQKASLLCKLRLEFLRSDGQAEPVLYEYDTDARMLPALTGEEAEIILRLHCWLLVKMLA